MRGGVEGFATCPQSAHVADATLGPCVRFGRWTATKREIMLLFNKKSATKRKRRSLINKTTAKI